MKKLALALTLLLAAGSASGETIILGPNLYQVTEGVDFMIGNIGSSDYTFSWSDGSGTFTGIVDPSLVLTIGETYTFKRVTSAHPLVITNATLPVDGTDGSYFRTTTDEAVIDAATLTPIADFTADPAPTSDLISWTPGLADTGNFFYTCRVTGHTGMTGGIRIQAPAVPIEEKNWSAIKAIYAR